MKIIFYSKDFVSASLCDTPKKTMSKFQTVVGYWKFKYVRHFYVFMALQSAFLLAQDVEGPVNGLKGDLITQ